MRAACLPRRNLCALATYALVATAACAADEGGDDSSGGPVEVTGAVAKGPFVLGSSVQVAAVDDALVASGQVFPTQTSDDLGRFELTVDYQGLVRLEASGFYYNEVTGELSTSQLTLRAFGRIEADGEQSIYINTVSHLANLRIENLVEGGASLDDAVVQAEQELRAALGVGPDGFDPGTQGTNMNLLGGDDDANAYLLAVSATLAKAAELRAGPDGSVDASLQEIVNAIAVDLEGDGELGEGLTDELRAGERGVDPVDVMTKLQARLEAVGLDTEVPDLGRVLDRDADDIPFNDDCEDLDPLRWTGNADLDGDGQETIACGGTDCDDDNENAYQGAAPSCETGGDADCDGLPDELSGCSDCTPVGDPQVLGSANLGFNGGAVPALWVAGDVAYAIGGEFGSTQSLWTIDLGDPGAPALLGGPESLMSGENQPPGGLFVRSGLAFVSQNPGLAIFDVSDPGSPTPTASPLTTGGYAGSVWVDGSIAYMGSHVGIWPVDVGDPSSPTLLGDAGLPDYGTVTGLAMSASGHLVAATNTGVAVVDISNPTSMQLVGGPLGSNLARLTRSGDVIIGYPEDGMETPFGLDVSEPDNPVLLDLALPSAPQGFAFGDYLVQTTDAGMLEVYDISDLDNPALIGSTAADGAGAVFVAGGHAFVGTNSGEVIAVDLNCM